MCAFFQNKRVETLSLADLNFQVCRSFSISLFLKIKGTLAFMVLDTKDGIGLFTVGSEFVAGGMDSSIRKAKEELSQNFFIPEDLLDFSRKDFILGFAKEDKIEPRETHFHSFFLQEIDIKKARELEERSRYVRILGYYVEDNRVYIFSGGDKFPHNHFQAILKFVRGR